MAALKTRANNFRTASVLATRYSPQISCVRKLNLQEYHSKDLLRKHHVSIQNFRLIDSKLDSNSLSGFRADEYVVKAQILAGGRGKGHFDNGFKGGVHLTKNPNEILDLAKHMIGHKLITKQTPQDGILVDKVMVAESVNIKRETYLSIVMERSYNGAALVASPAGGMDIEAVAEKTPHLLKTVPIDIYDGITDKMAKDVAEFLEFKGDMVAKCADEIKKLWELFLHQEAASLNLTYIDMDGSIGCMVNGAGLAMATMDLIMLSGGKPANFLDLGGGVGQSQVSAALRILESDPKVKAIFVNVFGGIVNCATIANGIVASCKENPPKHPLVIRLEGTNAAQAKTILETSGLKFDIINDADLAAKTAVQLANKQN
ncbi:succinate--CoA ligase [GDP-forming] subunit beta, mitochondrial isoform X2 [Leptidea sinapis]|uniref:succinate--CoA ligase [GDP-forming] subunit beta, mitochondrial isoform X2 n=1 Tax=Leptidea sinapis TaxID=189913 RepID=UPI00212E98E4|nr:succinate--CoA ligase [GDP-forming] subunit beta, mitochondrial isoform X2 [Leptidea sinapis]